MEPYAIKFAGNDISQLPNVDLYNHNFNDLPLREIKINKIARRDKSIITSSEYSRKDILVWVEVCGGSRAGTESALLPLKALLQVQNGSLVVSQGGVDVEYTATMNEFNIEWSGITALVTVVFLASDPIGQQVEAEAMATILGITTSSDSLSFTVEGSSLAYPLINVTVNTVTGGTGGQITIQNGLTNQGIRVGADYVDGDLLEIDSENLTVTINGRAVDFSGMFPQFSAGSQQITYSDSFTTRDVDLVATYNPRIV